MALTGTEIVKLPLDEPRRGRARRIVLIVGLTALVSAPGLWLVARSNDAKLAASAAFWRVEGTPCAPLDAKTFRGIQRAPSVTPYDGVVYERHGGGMMCTHRTETIGGGPVRYQVCKFQSPDYLGVIANGPERFYDLSMGRAAAIQVVNGQVKCVVAAKFEM